MLCLPPSLFESLNDVATHLQDQQHGVQELVVFGEVVDVAPKVQRTLRVKMTVDMPVTSMLARRHATMGEIDRTSPAFSSLAANKRAIRHCLSFPLPDGEQPSLQSHLTLCSACDALSVASVNTTTNISMHTSVTSAKISLLVSQTLKSSP